MKIFSLCVSFLNQTLPQSSSLYSFFIFPLPYSHSAAFSPCLIPLSFLSGPLSLSFLYLALSLGFISNHGSFCSFSPVICKFSSHYSPLNPSLFFCPFLHDSQNRLLPGWFASPPSFRTHANRIKISSNIWPCTWPRLSCRDQSFTLAGPQALFLFRGSVLLHLQAISVSSRCLGSWVYLSMERKEECMYSLCKQMRCLINISSSSGQAIRRPCYISRARSPFKKYDNDLIEMQQQKLVLSLWNFQSWNGK